MSWRAVLLAAAMALLGACSARSLQPTQTPTATRPAAATTMPSSQTRPLALQPLTVKRATPTPCATNHLAHLVLVDVSQQQAWLCAGHTLTRTTPVTTGETVNGDDTPTGTWQINSKQSDRNLYTRDGGVYHVQYWLPFQDELYGFHDASWQTIPFGSSKYHVAGSHGCVHLPLAAMAFLYHWATVGTTVTIRT